jgi:hypothetical protein
MATPGFVSARLVTVEIAESGVANERICVLLSIDDACLPGAELISERFFSTIGAPIARGRIWPLIGFGTPSTRCHPGKKKCERRSTKRLKNECRVCLNSPGSPQGEDGDGTDAMMSPRGARGWAATRYACSAFCSSRGLDASGMLLTPTTLDSRSRTAAFKSAVTVSCDGRNTICCRRRCILCHRLLRRGPGTPGRFCTQVLEVLLVRLRFSCSLRLSAVSSRAEIASFTRLNDCPEDTMLFCFFSAAAAMAAAR